MPFEREDETRVVKKNRYQLLFEARIILLDFAITPETAPDVIAMLLLLEQQSETEDIKLYINSPGGTVDDGLAIYDVMQLVKPDVATLCLGRATSMAAFLLAGGTKGKRYSLPNATIMLHQIMGGSTGQASDMEIQVRHMVRVKERMNAILANNTGKTVEAIARDCDRDFYLTPDEAVAYGLIDRVLRTKEDRPRA